MKNERTSRLGKTRMHPSVFEPLFCKVNTIKNNYPNHNVGTQGLYLKNPPFKFAALVPFEGADFLTA